MENKEVYKFGPFRLEARERLLLREGEPVQITGKAFDLLLVLLRSAGHLKTREELIEALWPNTIVEDTNLAWNMNGLRRALGDTDPRHRYVETVRGHGYRFIAPVQKCGLPEPALAIPPARPSAEETPADVREPTSQPRRRSPFAIVPAGILALAIAGFLIWYLAFHVSGPAPRGAATKSPAIPSRSIAVLPFEDLSPKAGNAYFVSGVQELIVTKLAGIGDLKVVSRASTEAYPSRPQNLKTIAKQLGVATILEGSVQKAGNQVLINVQLIDVATDNHLWAQAYQRALNNVFDVEGDVAARVAAALKAKIAPIESARVASVPTTNAQAYDSFLRAEYLATHIETESIQTPAAAAQKAVMLYRKAVAQDPDFALAWARLSYLESYLYWYNFDRTSAHLADAERAAERALALDPSLPQAHLAMGFTYYWGHRDYAKALAQFERAQRGLPNNADAVLAIAAIARRQGKWQAAVNGFRRASALDPRNPRWPEELGNTLTNLRRYAEAGAAYDQALAIEPHDYNAVAYKALALLLAGNFARARQTLAAIPKDIHLRGLIRATKFELAWLHRRPKAALAALAGAPEWVQAPLMVDRIPSDLLRGAAWKLAGNKSKAQGAYKEAKQALSKAIKSQSDNPTLWSALGLADAALDRPRIAIGEGQHAMKLLPVSKDALYGPAFIAAMAQIYTSLGKADPAVKLLDQLLAMPAGWVISRPLLKSDPRWDAIRKTSGFQALLRAPVKPAPAATRQ